MTAARSHDRRRPRRCTSKWAHRSSKIHDKIARHGITLRSSNYELYADMNRRFNAVIAEFSYVFEIYSIDETFLRLSLLANGLGDVGTAQALRAAIMRQTGLHTRLNKLDMSALRRVARELAEDMESGELDQLAAGTTPADDGISSTLSRLNRDVVHGRWKAALNRRSNDPEGRDNVGANAAGGRHQMAPDRSCDRFRRQGGPAYTLSESCEGPEPLAGRARRKRLQANPGGLPINYRIARRTAQPAR